MKSAIIALTCCVMLSACATGHSNPIAAADRIDVPDVIEYPQSVREKAAVELIAGSCPVLADMNIDYGVMRDQARAARGVKVDVRR